MSILAKGKAQSLAIALFICMVLPSFSRANVCSEGLGLPPFLDAGADPNLLLAIDNSGSMLDMAYTDENSQCFDETYLTNVDTNGDPIEYAGNFDRDKWYAWSFGLYAPWQTGVGYAPGDRVYTDGIIYEMYADASCTATGAFLVDDTGCDWKTLQEFEAWTNNTSYLAGTILFKNNQFYRNSANCTSSDSDPSDGIDIYGDTVCVWTAIDSSYIEGNSYSDGDVVSYQGMFFEATAATSSSPADTGGDWQLLDEGKFVETTVSNIATHCNAAPGTAEYVADALCISTDASVTPIRMTQFVAKGNFLNWASASKFDIQKQILTGGKHDYTTGLLISESRGCSGKGFTKQVQLASSNQLTLRARGRTTEGYELLWDQVDSVDDTTRIDVLGISAGGFDYEKCEAAVEKILDHGINGTQNLVDQCLEAPPAVDNGDQRAALNHALQYCWQSNYNLGKIYEDTGSGAGSCQTVYQDNDPSSISPWYNAYHCSGVYDPSLPHDERVGYVGRCWNQGGASGGTDPLCLPKPAVPAPTGCDTDGCTYGDLGGFYKNEGGYNYECTDVKVKNGVVYCKKEDDWELLYLWDDGTSGSCNAGDIWGGGTATAGWSGEIDGNLTTTDPDSVTQAEADEADIPNNLGDLNSDAEYLCIWQAMEDYCSDLTTPEVIDPSDDSGVTTEYGNLPANLIDSGVMSQLGIEHPLAVMKGYIEQVDRPEGIIHEVAQELRMGAMAFNYVGAETECGPDYVTGNVERFCPEENIDGAKLITPIELGALVKNSDNTFTKGERWHVDDMAESINWTRATSWTPLAEAVFNAVGYYTQNTTLCINKDAGGNCVDFPINAAEDPVEYWCQENHIIIISEGESTADIQAEVAAFVNAPLGYFGEGLLADESMVDYPGDVDGDPAPPASCSTLIGSTFLDDMTWWGQNAEPLYATRQLGPVGFEQDKRPITTHLVTTGALGSTVGGDECNPRTLMTNAAINGDTTLYAGENPDELETNLEAALLSILGRASAGSAASVISSSRSGEGAVYQAVFWPEITRNLAEDPLAWVGDVHGLFIDNDGFMWDDRSYGAGTPAENAVAAQWSEDSNGNGRLDTDEDLNGNGCLDGDRRVFYYFDGNDSRICFNDSAITSDPAVCDTAQTDYCDAAGEPLQINEFNQYLWSAKDSLQAVNDISTNREISSSTGRWVWDPLFSQRYLFTWNDLDNDGTVDSDGSGDPSDEIIPLISHVPGDPSDDWDWDTNYVQTDHSVLDDFLMADKNEMNGFIEWFRGSDNYFEEDTNTNSILDPAEDINGSGFFDYVYRCRRYPDCYEIPNPALPDYRIAPDTLVNPEWRLGDVIHSTPKLVAQPAEAFHTIYRDPSYAFFVKKYRFRRHMIYFGANDGMLHAVNGGFYDAENNRFWRNQEPVLDATTSERTGEFTYNNTGPELGTEMWAYVPYNLQPHLKCLSDPEYKDSHKYFVDKEARIFDMQIFQEEAACTDTADTNDGPYSDGCIHPGGWGTILVGAMRFGGAPITAADPAAGGGWDPMTDERQFTSAYFVLDITDPERPPTLLGETTRTTEVDGSGNPLFADLGFSTPMPTGIVMRDDGSNAEFDDGETKWYLVLGNGPTTIKGENDQQGKLAILPMKWLTGVEWSGGKPAIDYSRREPFRVPNASPAADDYDAGGIVPIEERDAGGILIADSDGESFVSDLITADLDTATEVAPDLGGLYKSDAVYFGTVDGDGFTPDAIDSSITRWLGGGRAFRLVTREVGGDGYQSVSPPSDWTLKKLADAQGPISGALSLGWDGSSYWIYYGTGRFLATEDKTDDTTQHFFGIREPLDNSCEFTWATVGFEPVDWSTYLLPAQAPGNRGLVRSDYILVPEFDSLIGQTTPLVFCDSSAPGGACELSYLGFSTSVDGITMYRFEDLEEYIAGKGRLGPSGAECTNDSSSMGGVDGWFMELREPRERVIGQSTLLGGLNTFTSYQPFDDVCTAEGLSYLYGVYYKTGTAWYENVFGLTYNRGGYGSDNPLTVLEKYSLGRGLATTPSLHTGSGSGPDAKAYVQTSTGEIIQIDQENLPIKPPRSGRILWSDQSE